jgi:hypothetical protein
MKAVRKTISIVLALVLVCFTVSVCVANDDSLYVDTNGDVGIGTTQPSAKLDVQVSSFGQSAYIARKPDGMEWYSVKIFDGSVVQSFNGDYPIQFHSNGPSYIGYRLGIGTTTPISKLQISAPASDSASVQNSNLYLRGSNQGYGVVMGTKLNYPGGAWIQGTANDSVDAIDLLLNPAAGNVGIGTTTPTSKMSVVVGGVNEGTDVVSASGWIRFMPGTMGDGSYNSLSRAGDNGIIFSGGSVDTGSLVIGPHANSAAGIKITNIGDVGIGTSVPKYKLDVNGNLHVNGDIFMDSARVLSSSGRMHIMGEELLYLLNKDGVIIGKEFGGNGNLTVEGLINGVVVGNSDIRWKENIEPIEDALDIVSQLRGVSYEWIDPSRGQGRQIGVIAQEVEQVLPEVVHTDSQGYKSVEYSKLVAPLIEAVKALKAKNDRLEAENQYLKTRSDNLELRLSVIEAKLAD